MSALNDTPPSVGGARAAGVGNGHGTAYQQVQRTPEFAALRKRWRRFIFAMSAVFLLWFLFYVVLAGFFVDIVNTPVLGNINLGVVLGLLQFVSTFVIATVYVGYASRNLDPEAERLRREVENKL